MILTLKFLRESQCPNLWHDMLHAGNQIGAAVEVPDEIARLILAACGVEAPKTPAPAPRVPSVPFEQWPLAFQLLAKAARPKDTGLGDVIERVVGPIGGLAFKLWFKRITARDCGCTARKQKLNAQYPLNLHFSPD
jgi:hypothetical protein